MIRGLGLGEGALPETETVESLSEVAAQISVTERRAMKAERETADRLIAHFLADRIGATFQGRISGVTRAGLFVKLSDTGADGLIPIRTLGTEYFNYDETRHALVGTRSGAMHRLGDVVDVRLVEAAPVAGALRFELLSEGQTVPRGRKQGARDAARAQAQQHARRIRAAARARKIASRQGQAGQQARQIEERQVMTVHSETVNPATKVWTSGRRAVRAKRDVWTSIKRGLRGRCPRCGEGKLFRAFLKVDNNCSVCGLDFTPHRADDLPAYLVIIIVGHIVVPMALMIETNYSPPVALQLAIYLPITLIASLLLLQPVKGAVVGMQWALRMHGFDEQNPEQ